MLTLTTVEDEIISTSLDQTVSVWSNPDGRFKCYLPGVQDYPAYCVAVTSGLSDTTNNVVIGSGSNR